MISWHTFTKKISIIEPLDIVYKCWSTQKELETWFLEKAEFYMGENKRELTDSVEKGDSFKWKWNNWKNTEKGWILDTNGKDFISFTFGSGGTVSVQLKEDQNTTVVELTQYNIPTDEKSRMDIYVGCVTGWTFWLTNLKAYLEHEITLHAKGLTQ